MGQKIFVYCVYVSLLFLGISLYKAEYLFVPGIHSTSYLLASVFLLISGFIFNGVAWGKTLQKSGYSANFRLAISSSGLSIFGKYVPGKVWVVLGRATYISHRHGYPLHELSMLSLQAEFIMLWLGLVLGGIGLLLLQGFHLWSGLLLSAWFAMSILVFTPGAKRGLEYFSALLLRKNIYLPRLDVKTTLSLLPWFLTTWGLWSIGFHLFVSSIADHQVLPQVAFGFPLAASLGIVAIFAPGGLGIREGVIVAYLVLTGVTVQDATTISVAARLWTLIGEVFMFVVSLFLVKLDTEEMDE